MILIDNVVNSGLLRYVYETWPDQTWRGWHHYSDNVSEKYGSKSLRDLSSPVKECLYQMIDKIDFEAKYNDCFPDLELYGSGMHMLTPEGFLKRHLDASQMEATGWKREYSCVLFANPEWKKEWGGDFNLEPSYKVFPKFNTLCIFKTTEDSWHWINKVTGPIPRCTLSLFYWSKQPINNIRTKAQFKEN